MSGKIVVEAEFDTGSAARRLRTNLAEIFGQQADFAVVHKGGLRKGTRYMVRVVSGGEQLARQAGLVDGSGRPVRACHHTWSLPGSATRRPPGGGLPRPWFLDRTRRSSALEITCPGPESALALVGAARRMGIPAKSREVRGVERVVIRDGDAISQMLARMGAHASVLVWEERRTRREVRATANRLANFDDANLRRSARAAVAASQRVERALEILGDDVPDHLAAAGRLRMEHRQSSLEELRALANPPMTKDAIAGRIRRLLGLADRRARELGIPDTEVGLAPTTNSCDPIGLRCSSHRRSNQWQFASASTDLVVSVVTSTARWKLWATARPHSATSPSKSSPSTTRRTTQPLAHLLPYDSVLGRLPGTVTSTDSEILVDGVAMKALGERDPPPSAGRPRSRLRHRVDRPLHKGRGRQEAHGRRGQEGHHLRARQG